MQLHRIPYHAPYQCLATGMLVISLMLISAKLYAQAGKARGFHWYFGPQYGLDFSKGFAEPDHNTAMWTYEACCTMSDKFGNLLYYTNAGGREGGPRLGYIWNRNHEPMEGGELLGTRGGGYSSSQGCITFEKPGHPGTYCLFTVDERETLQNANNTFPQGKGCSYFEIDMKANNGLGRVTISNQKILTPAFEFISATKHGNCEDYWLIVPTGHYELENDFLAADSLYVFLIDAAGIQAPVKFAMPQGNPSQPDEYGIIKIAPDGSRFTCGSFLYDFDKYTGQISNPVNLMEAYGMQLDDPLCFSANSRFLYRFRRERWDTTTVMTVIQFDLHQPDPPAAAVNIGQQEFQGIVVFGSPQLGPDGQIYALFQEGGYPAPSIVSTIRNPNLKGEAAQFEARTMFITNGVQDARFLRFGNFTDHLFAYDPVLEVAGASDVKLPCDRPLGSWLYAPPDMDCYLWSNGEQSDSIWVDQPGTYWVEFYKDCLMGVDTVLVIVDDHLEGVELGADTLLCEGDLLHLQPAQQVGLYLWQDGSTGQSYTVNSPGMYWVEVRKGGCFDRDSIEVRYTSKPIARLPEEVRFCLGEELVLAPGKQPEGTLYQWSDGSAVQDLSVNQPGRYWVLASNECGNSLADVLVRMEDCNNERCQIFIPNLFTPNGDGINDQLAVFADCSLAAYHLQIFNRWGGLLFESRDPQERWDGRTAGQRLNNGVYVYRLRYQELVEGEWRWQQKSGDVGLVH